MKNLKKIVTYYLLTLGVILGGVYSCNAQINTSTKAIASFNTDSATVKTYIANTVLGAGSTGGLYWNKQSQKWRISKNNVWYDLTVGNTPVSNRTKYGLLYKDTYDRSSIGPNYTIDTPFGTPVTATVTGGVLTFFGGTGASYLYYSAYKTCIEQLTRVVKYVIATKSAFTQGFYLGMHSDVSDNQYLVGEVNTTGSTSSIRWKSGAGDNPPITQSTNINPFTDIVGDTITATVTPDHNYVFASFKNHRTLLTNSDQFLLPELATSPSGAFFTMTASTIGDGYYILSDSVYSVTYTNPDLVILETSIGYGSAATQFYNAVSDQLKTKYHKEVVSLSHPEQQTTSINIPEALRFKGDSTKYYIGSLVVNNRINGGQNDAQAETAYLVLVNALKAGGLVEGVNLFYSTLPPNGYFDVSVFNNWLRTTFPAIAVIDQFTQFSDGATNINAIYSPDQLHLNNLGQEMLVNNIAQFMGYTSFTDTYPRAAFLYTPQTFTAINTFSLSPIITPLIGAGTQMVTADINGVLSKQAIPSSGTPGGSNTQIQFNNSGTFGGNAALVFVGNTTTATNVEVTTVTPTHIMFAGTNGKVLGDTALTFNSTTKAIRLSGNTYHSDFTPSNSWWLTSTTHTGGGFLRFNSNTIDTDTQLVLQGAVGVSVQSTSGSNATVQIDPDGTGDIRLETSSGGGSFLIINNLPASCAGVPTNGIANVAGVLTVCP